MKAVSPVEFIRTAYNYLASKSVAGKNVIVFPDDTFLVSYQRSGNTWTRFLIANLIHLQSVSFLNIEDLIPDIYVCSQKFLLGVRRPRLLKSHEPFDPRYKKIIYIVRDPRDVALSMYHWQMKRGRIGDEYPVEQFVTRFITGEYEPGAGSWGQNVGSWLATRGGTPGFLVLRYESIMQDCTNELARIASFLGLERTAAQMDRAAELSSANHMRELERQQSKVWKTTQNTRQDKAFVRSAKMAGWKDELPPASVAEIESSWGSLMKILGYELTADVPQENLTGQQALLQALLSR